MRGPASSRASLALLALAAPTWFAFYTAYQDGLQAQRRGDHALAIRAFTRAIQLQPRPGTSVPTYGLNFLDTYHPYLRLAESCLALGDLRAAEQALAQSERFGAEPAGERAMLRQRIQARLAPPPEPPSYPRPSQPAPNPGEGASSPIRAAPVQAVQPPVADPPPSARPVPAKLQAPPSSAPPTQVRPQTVPPSAPPSAVPQALPSSLPGKPARSLPWPWIAGPLLLAGGFAGFFILRTTFRLRKRSDPRDDPNLDRDFGPYRPIRLLGEGGCGSAYLAVHRRTGVQVAIKVPHRHLINDPQFRLRFQREAALGARLDHPHIVRILTPEPKEDDPWIAMTFVRGVTLDAYLQREGPLPVPAALALALDVAGAMAHAHAMSVVHRDLKPANIMLNEQGAMVMDFGIARILDAARTTSTLFMGTPAYAAPECLLYPQVGPAADRYALGIILFEMLTGEPPFLAPSPFQVLEAHRKEPIPDLCARVPGVPPRLARLVERLCLKDPVERPEDGETLTGLRSCGVTPSWPPPAGVPPA